MKLNETLGTIVNFKRDTNHDISQTYIVTEILHRNENVGSCEFLLRFNSIDNNQYFYLPYEFLKDDFNLQIDIFYHVNDDDYNKKYGYLGSICAHINDIQVVFYIETTKLPNNNKVISPSNLVTSSWVIVNSNEMLFEYDINEKYSPFTI